jgi:superfamily II DNA or RNA helicase
MNIDFAADIDRLIGKTYADRGRVYVQQSRVAEWSDAEGRRMVFSRVRGSGGASYTQSIALGWSDDGHLAGIDGECSCPIGYNCKHVAAVLFIAAAVWGMDLSPTPKRTRASSPKVAPQALSGPLQVWLESRPKQAETAADDYPATVQNRIHYVLNREQDHLIVQPYKVRLKKDGTPGKGARRYDFGNINSPTPPKFVLPVDFRIRRYLSLAGWYSGHHSGSRLPDGEEGSKTLELLISTGRARWLDLAGIALVGGPERAGRLFWHQDTSGSQSVRAESVDGAAVIPLPIEPLWYIDPNSGECGPLETDLPPERAMWLAAAPTVSAREARQFVDSLGIVEGGSSLPLPRQIETVTHSDVQPTPSLRLHSTKAQVFDDYDWRYYRPRTGPKEIVPALSLTFDYDGTHVRPDDDASIIESFDGEKLQVVPRNIREETRHLADLDDIANPFGFEQPSSLSENVQVAGKDAPDFILWPFETAAAGPQHALEFLRLGTDALRDLGWQINIGKDWPCHMHEGEHSLSASVNEDESGWFSLALNIEVDGKQIDLLPLVLQFLRALPPEALAPEFDFEAFLTGRNFYLRLADGRYLPLEAGSLAPVLKALLALHGVGEKMHPAEAGSINDIARALDGSDIAFTGGKKLLALGAQLRALASTDAGSDSGPPLPKGFTGELRPYQKTGLGWMTALGETGFGGALADDMGLGKTVQALAYLAARTENTELPKRLPSLLIVPTSLVGTWAGEAARFTPDLKVLVLHGPERKSLFDQIDRHDIVITTYPLLHRDCDVLFAQSYDTVILDEAQMVKNPASRAAKLIRDVQARQRLALTGTPMENNLEELWSLFDWLIPGLLGNRKTFGQVFRKPIEKEGDRAAQARLNKRISPFLLRRTKEQVAADLPPKTVITETISLSGPQRELYETIRIAMDKRVRAALDQKGLAGSRITVLDALLKLRQVCCDPALVKLPAARDITASAKRTHLLAMLDELMAEGRRVLVFSQFVQMLHLIEDDIKARGYDYAWLSGKTKNRTELVERFQSGDVPIFLISLKAGGIGLTLTAADTVILYDPWWNPAVERQAMDRAHRIGQEKPVFVHRLITEGTVETQIEAIQARKQDLADALFDPQKTGPAALSEADILSLFQPLSG